MTLSRALAGSLLALAAFSASAAEWLDRYFDLLPQHSQLSAARGTPALAWLGRQAGEQSLWIAIDGKPRVLHRYGDDGLPVSGLSLSPDGAWLAYFRGSAPNGQGEINNPLDAPDPQERVLWLLPTRGDGAPRRVAGGAQPLGGAVFAPDGRRLAWTVGREAWALDLADPAAAPQRLFTIRGTAAELGWSPDGRRLSFVSRRGTHSFVGVFDLAGRSIRYLAPGLDQDQMPSWSRDGRHLAFLRVPEEVQSYRFTPRLESVPWSIMLADTRSWDVRTLWTAATGAGSTAGKGVDTVRGEHGLRPPLLWTADGQLVFSWERSGWSQLYRIGVEGGAPQRLSQGEGEIPAAGVSGDGRWIHYIANARERENFDLYRVDARGGVPQRLSGDYGAGYRQPPVALADGRVAFLGYDARTPGQVVLAGPDARPAPALADFLPRDFPSDTLVVPEVVELTAEDGGRSRALLFRPAGARGPGKRPGVVYVHGGSRSIETFEPHHGWGLVEALVNRGYVVLLPNFRSGLGYGLAFREAPGYGGSGGTDTLDAIAAGRYLAGLAEVDAARIGIFGISYGGYLTTASLAKAPDLWAAGASLVGVADWQMELELDKGGARLPFRVSQRMQYEDLAHASSANAHLEGWRAPLLFISGDDDQDGWLVQAIELGQRLRRRGIEVEALVEPGGTHGAATHRQLRARVQRFLEFFDRHLD